MWTLKNLQQYGAPQTKTAFQTYRTKPLKKNVPDTRHWRDPVRKVLKEHYESNKLSVKKADVERLVRILARIARDSALGKSPVCGLGSTSRANLVLKIDTREKVLVQILGQLPFVEVVTLTLGDIEFSDERDQDRTVLIERKRDDDALQNMKKLEQQRSRLVEWVQEKSATRRALFIHETPSWATDVFLDGTHPLPSFCRFQNTYSQHRQSLTPAELGLSIQSATVLTYNLPWVSSAHTWHTAALVLDFYRCWAKNQKPKSTAVTASAEKCAQVRASSSTGNPTLQFFMLCLGPQKGSAVFGRWKSLEELTRNLRETPHATEKRLTNLRYGQDNRRVGPKNARNLIETLGFKTKEPAPKKRKLL